jgi:hypothetical protein
MRVYSLGIAKVGLTLSVASVAGTGSLVLTGLPTFAGNVCTGFPCLDTGNQCESPNDTGFVVSALVTGLLPLLLAFLSMQAWLLDALIHNELRRQSKMFKYPKDKFQKV